MEVFQVGWYVNTPAHSVLWHRWVNIEQGAKFEEVSCYFSATVMRIFLVLLSNVYLHSQDFRCKFGMEYAKPGWGFLWLWEPTCLIRAQRRWQGWQTSPRRVIVVDLTNLAPGGNVLALFALHTFFLGHTKQFFLRKTLLLAKHLHFTVWTASVTAKCLRVSQF